MLTYIFRKCFVQKPHALFPHIAAIEHGANIRFAVARCRRDQASARFFGKARFYSVAAEIVEQNLVFVREIALIIVSVIRRGMTLSRNTSFFIA